MSYVNACKEAAASIDSDTLAQLEFNEVQGFGSGFVFRGLGALSILGESAFVGLKLPKKAGGDVEGRILQEVAQIDLIVTHSPALLTKMPRFACLLAVQGEEAQAILTEDFTQAGSRSLGPMRTSPETRALLYEPFSHYGTMDEVLEQETLDIATACRIDGKEEKLLDFTPFPLRDRVLWIAGGNEMEPHLEAAVEQLQDYTVTIPADSPLGETLVTRHQRINTPA